MSEGRSGIVGQWMSVEGRWRVWFDACFGREWISYRSRKNWQKIWDLLPQNEIKRTQSIRISVPAELPQRPYSPSQRTQSPVQTQSLPTWFLPQSGTRWPRGYRPWWIQKRGCSVHSWKSPLAFIISNLSVTVAPTVYLMSYQKRFWIQRRAGGGKC